MKPNNVNAVVTLRKEDYDLLDGMLNALTAKFIDEKFSDNLPAARRKTLLRDQQSLARLRRRIEKQVQFIERDEGAAASLEQDRR